MAQNPRRPRFYFMVLVTGFLLGGFLNAFLKAMLPNSPTKAFFTYTVSPGFGPVPINLLVVHFTIGPAGLELSLMSLLGVILAYLIARSLF
ncbi:MAG TPA: DUF4321 domain-containing protein [Gemmatimonadales bacterium]|jgi:hypothetical protein|nr:DUF4321 domain-containing protein [Gemmatimonadales bacterium]